MSQPKRADNSTPAGEPVMPPGTGGSVRTRHDKDQQPASTHSDRKNIQEAEEIGPEPINPVSTSSSEELRIQGDALMQQGESAAAIACYRQCLAIQPNDPGTYNNLGNALRAQGNLQGAITCFRQAIALNSTHPGAYNNLGNALREQGDRASAIAAYQAALRCNPNYPEAHNNLGNVLQDAGELAAAIRCFQTALALKPNYPGAYNNLGNALKQQGHLLEAMKAYTKALELEPENARAQAYLAIAELLRGNYTSGLKRYDYRFQTSHGKDMLCAQPQCHQWNGDNLNGRTLYLVSEQGLGDTLQFMRYALALRKMGIQVHLCAPEKLHPLIQASGIDPSPLTPEQANAVTQGAWLPLLTVLQRLNISPENPIITEPYIRSQNTIRTSWNKALSPEKRPIIGINWQGNPNTEHADLQGRSLPLEAFGPITRRSDLSLLALQQGAGLEQLESCSFKHRFVRCQPRISASGDFLQTAGIIANCDLVITSDTAVAHLAGGMGRPTWLLLHNNPDWRWGLTGETSCWYPSMRLFRQRQPGNWEEVMERVAQALQNLETTGTTTGDQRENLQRAEHTSLQPTIQPQIAASGSAHSSDELRAFQLLNQGKAQEAAEIYERLIREHTSNHKTYGNLAAIYAMQRQWKQAITLLQQALTLKADYPEALNNLGAAYREQGDLDAALSFYQRALEIRPAYADAYNNMGVVLREQGQLEGAIAAYQQALSIKSNYAEAHFNLANALKERGDLKGAIEAYNKALELKPGDPDTHKNLSMAELLTGDYQRGWARYNYRFLTDADGAILNAKPDLPLWNGEPPAHAAQLLIVSEQGLGDTLQFIRYAVILKQQGYRVSICAPTKLHGLIKASGLDTAPRSPQQANASNEGCWIPMLSVPRHLGVSPEKPILNTPYIQVGQALVQQWAEKLAGEKRPILAVNWQGNSNTEKTILRGRSFPLEALAPIAEEWKGSLLSLQKGTGSEQLASCSFRDRFVSCQDQIDATWDFLDTAAIIANCDLVITSDTAVAHLAGGMGQTTWLLLHKVPDWRWGLTGNTSFWYPSMRLFRQHNQGDWPDLIKHVRRALTEWAQQSQPSAPTTSAAMDNQPTASTAMDIAGMIALGNLQEAEAACKQQIRNGPDAATHFHLGIIYRATGRNNEAIAALSQGLQMDPNNAAAYNKLGAILHAEGHHSAAISCFERALSLKPDYAEAVDNKGAILQVQGRFDEAIPCHLKAIELCDRYTSAHYNLGNAFYKAGRLEEAAQAYQTAIEQKPTHNKAHNNLGSTLLEQGDVTSALVHYKAAVAIAPDDAGAQKNLSMAELLTGDYENGWPRYDYRLQDNDEMNTLIAKPKGPLLRGQLGDFNEPLLIMSEQGLGDTLQFMRYLPILRERGLRFSFCAPENLHGLIQASGIDAQPRSPAQANSMDASPWLPLLSLAGLLKVTPQNPLINKPYIKTLPRLIAQWQHRLANTTRPIVGIHWQGNPSHECSISRGRSIPLEALASISRQTKGTLLSLQKGAGSEQLNSCSFLARFVDCQPLINETWDFLETAAIVGNCDIIITNDTALAHLAAGMGQPTWLLLKHVPEWRWGLTGNSSFWYPSMRLFRQRENESWADTCARVGGTLSVEIG